MKNLHTFELYLKGEIGMNPESILRGINQVVKGIKLNQNITTIKCHIKSTILQKDNEELQAI